MELQTQNQPIDIVPPPSQAPRRSRVAHWLTLAVLALFIGGGSVFLILRNDPGVAAAPVATVEISGSNFTPQTVKVKKGDSITWVNADTAIHNVSANNPDNPLPELDSLEPLAQGDSYTATFDKAGTYTYHDSLNPLTLNGVVIVE